MRYDKMNNNDTRVIRTKKEIRNAFAYLLANKNINDITIKNISDTAGINRRTFYNYYGGIHEILDEIENGIVSDYEKVVEDIDLVNGEDNMYKIFDTLTRIFSEDLEFYGILLDMKRNSQLIQKIIEIFKVKAKEGLRKQTKFDENKLDMIVNFSVSGMFGAYRNWFNSGREQSLEDFSKDVGKILISGIQGC